MSMADDPNHVALHALVVIHVIRQPGESDEGLRIRARLDLENKMNESGAKGATRVKVITIHD